MPIENECKYVLSPDLSEQDFSEWGKISIRQGYLDDGPRIRQYNGEYIFTYKRWIDSENATVEIETKLNEQDFKRLWACCNIFVTKTRYIKQDQDIEWVVDFLKDDEGDTYFILAEAEMPESMDRPQILRPEITPYILFAPEKGDKNYTNKKLANKDHALSILGSL